MPGVVRGVLKRLIGFELQFGPFAVAQLRLLAEIADLLELDEHAPAPRVRLYVADTLGNPDEENEWIPHHAEAAGGFAAGGERDQAGGADHRRHRQSAVQGEGQGPGRLGRGGQREHGGPPLAAWMPPAAWGAGAHAKHLRNLYVYFWRWASWKVFGDGAPGERKGVVCFITVAGFLNGPGFQKMRADLRRDSDEIWVIDCSPEGHQPEVPTRVFQGVQQPACIVLAARLANTDPARPARVRFRALPAGRREEKFAAIAALTLEADGWTDCPDEWRAPFLPAPTGDWASFPALEAFFDLQRLRRHAGPYLGHRAGRGVAAGAVEAADRARWMISERRCCFTRTVPRRNRVIGTRASCCTRVCTGTSTGLSQ